MSDSGKPRIEARENGPYVLSNLSTLRTSRGEAAKTSESMVLCRCGKSSSKPHCDGTHVKVAFKSRKLEGRQPDRTDDYAGAGITIHDNRGVCSHAGHCTDNLAGVFRMGAEPWIDPDGADVEEVIRVVKMCPSGALSYTLCGVRHDGVERGPAVEISKNGPYRATGGVELVDSGGDNPESEEHYTLCRCGGSRNKPFCDGTHWHIKFTDDELDVPLESSAAETVEEYLGNLKRGSDEFEEAMRDIQRIAITGESIIEPMRTRKRVVSWDDILIKGAQLARIPLNRDRPVNTRTLIGPGARHPLVIETPVYITHMSFGALSRDMKIALAKGSARARTAMCSGEGGIIPESMESAYRYIFEFVPNKYSVTDENLRRADAVEIKIGQSAKPGMGGHLPAAKVTEEIAGVRGLPAGRDIISPAHFDEITGRDGLREVVAMLRERSGGRPIGIKLAAGDIEGDLDAALHADPDFITIDGRAGATAAAPKVIKDATSVPTIFALSRARRFLTERGRSDVTLVITGGLRLSSDFAKALALGADAVAIGTAALIAAACQQYRICDSGECPVGVTTHRPELRARFDIEQSAERLENYLECVTGELRDFARLTGNDDVHGLSVEDLETVNSEISGHTEIPHV